MTLIDNRIKGMCCDCLQPGCPYCDPNGDRLIWQKEYTYEVILEQMLDSREEQLKEDYNSKIVDKLTEDVYHYLKTNFDALKFDTIIMALVRCGGAPQLVYDDNGKFAIACEGMCGVDHDKGIDMTLISIEEMWKENPKEALRFYLFEYDDMLEKKLPKINISDWFKNK